MEFQILKRGHKILNIKNLATSININLNDSTKVKKKTLKHLENEIYNKIDFNTLVNNPNIQINLKVKDVLFSTNLITEYINSQIPCRLQQFLSFNNMNDIFDNHLDLHCSKISKETQLPIVYKTSYKKNETDPEFLKKSQGLYLLTLENNQKEWIIVKIGSFAESQGLKGRLDSFGGGNYETGSITNKWFQQFCKIILIDLNLKMKMYYHVWNQPIQTIQHPLQTLDMTCYIMRPYESICFDIYRKINNYNEPLFGSNCL